MQINIDGKTVDTQSLRAAKKITVSDNLIRKRLALGWSNSAAVYRPVIRGSLSKLSLGDFLEIRKLYSLGHSQKRIGEWFGIAQNTVSLIVNRVI